MYEGRLLKNLLEFPELSYECKPEGLFIVRLLIFFQNYLQLMQLKHLDAKYDFDVIPSNIPFSVRQTVLLDNSVDSLIAP